MRGVAAAVGLAVLGGCTSVRMVQREGCWVRQTHRTFGGTHEEVGFCAAPPAPWVEGDRLTRIVQECAARADHRWQTRALAAFSKGEALPAKIPDDDVLRECMSESASAVVGEVETARRENEVLRRELAELTAERDALRAREGKDREALLASHAKLAEHLGEAAKKPQAPAIATATATGEGRTTTEASAQPAAPAAPGTVVVASPAQPVAAPAPGAQPAPCAEERSAPPRQARGAGPARARSTPAVRPECLTAPSPATEGKPAPEAKAVPAGPAAAR